MTFKTSLLSILILLSTTSFAQSKKDIKSIEKQKQKLLKKVERVEKYLTGDRSSVYNCHPDAEAPFADLKEVMTVNTEELKATIEDKFAAILDDSANGLVAKIESIEARKAEIKNQKDKKVRKKLIKLLRAQQKEAKQIAKNIAAEIEPSLKETTKSLISANGKLNLAMKEYLSKELVLTIFNEKIKSSVGNNMSPAENYNKSLSDLLNSCETKDCVYLMHNEVKNLLKATLATNKSIHIVAGAQTASLSTVSKATIFSKLEELVEAIASRKTLRTFDPNCSSKSVEMKEDDEFGGNKPPKTPENGGTEVIGGDDRELGGESPKGPGNGGTEISGEGDDELGEEIEPTKGPGQETIDATGGEGLG